MSQPSYPYDPTLPYQSPAPQPPSPRPTAVSALAIIGIVFGSLGVLCLGFGAVFQGIMLLNKGLGQSLNQPPPATIMPQLVLGIIGFILSGVLLVGSIGSLMLKDSYRRLMLIWARVDIVYDLLKLVLTLAIFLPQLSQNPQMAQNPQAKQMLPMMRAGAGFMAVVTWIIVTTFPVLVIMFFRKPEIVAAFERGPEGPPGFGSPLPPPPVQP